MSETAGCVFSVSFYPIKFKRCIVVKYSDKVTQNAFLDLNLYLKEIIGTFPDCKNSNAGFFLETIKLQISMIITLKLYTLTPVLAILIKIPRSQQRWRNETDRCFFLAWSHPMKFKLV